MFKDAEKIAIFNKIYACYFEHNFGTMSKSDLELLLFSEYYRILCESENNSDDYSISKQLGITQARVRSLREREALRFNSAEINWHDEFIKAIKYAKFDKDTKKVRMNIEDVVVMNEVRHYIEQKGWYDEWSLNKKLLTVTFSCFLEICAGDENILDALDAETKKAIIKEQKKNGADNAKSSELNLAAFREYTEKSRLYNLQEMVSKLSKDVIPETTTKCIITMLSGCLL